MTPDLHVPQASVVASIGPTTSETLVDYGVRPDFEPSHPKTGLLVNELASGAGQMLADKGQMAEG